MPRLTEFRRRTANSAKAAADLYFEPLSTAGGSRAAALTTSLAALAGLLGVLALLAQTSDLVITALGGAVGALILTSALKLLGVLFARRKPLAVYHCAPHEDEDRASSEASKPGELRHGWGHARRDSGCRNGMAWQYSSRSLLRPGDATPPEHTIYGPYLNDFGKPGFYRVRFRISGRGFSEPDEPVIVLDVVQAPFGTEQTLRLLGQKVIKARDLSPSYRLFDIVCYAEGTGVYEYRCTVFPQAITECSEVLFDIISVYSHPPLWEIL